jgi:hypothetical protein
MPYNHLGAWSRHLKNKGLVIGSTGKELVFKHVPIVSRGFSEIGWTT